MDSHDIRCNIMDRRKLKIIGQQIREARRRVATYNDLAAIAISLKRERLTGARARGKEPMFVSTEFQDVRPISIPFHGRNKSIPPGTAKNILNDLEADVLRFLERLDEEENDYVQEDSEGVH
jgi:hypothetical protein